MHDPCFLTLAEVIETHADQLKRYGGQAGVRDFGLLESALAQPEASFAGEWLHATLHDMAAAYAYHICQNHPFIDGNKRTALACALLFLELNDVVILDPKRKLKSGMWRLASGKMTKAELTRVLQSLPHATP